MYCMFFVIVLGTLLIVSELCAVLLTGPNVCESGVEDRKKQFCCFNHYPIDGHCQECENGTMSDDGLECRPCLANFYGNKCKYECKCESHERCDAESGCLDITTQSAENEMSSFSQSQNETKLTKSSEANPKLTTIPKETSAASTGIQVLCYMIVAAGLITWMIVCLKCSTCLPRMIRPKRSRQSTCHVPTCQMQEVRNNCKNNR